MAVVSSDSKFGTAKWIVSPSISDGATHTTIGGALTAASSGDTIFIRPGTYTENLTLKAGVNLTAYQCDASLNITGHVIINGTCSLTDAGTVTISGIQLQTNGAELLSVTGSAASIVELVGCYLNVSNNTGITFSSSSSSASVRIENSRGNIGTTGIALFSHSSAGSLSFNGSIFSNSGSSSTANTCSSGSISAIGSFFANPFTMSGTGRIVAKFCEIDSNSTNSTCLTTASGTTNELHFNRFASGTATPLSIAGTVGASGLVLVHTNATGITGAGTLLYAGGGIWQTSTVGAVSVTTMTPKFILGALNSTTPPAGMIGEQIRSAVASGSAITLTSGVGANVTSISLTPGIWDVSGIVMFGGGAITGTIFQASISTTSGTNGTKGDNFVEGTAAWAPTAAATTTLTIPSYRISLAATTTVYLVTASAFTAGTVVAFGRISATRVA